VLHDIRLGSLAKCKHSNLLGPLVTYEFNEYDTLGQSHKTILETIAHFL
jgi:hypothetical protein